MLLSPLEVLATGFTTRSKSYYADNSASAEFRGIRGIGDTAYVVSLLLEGPPSLVSISDRLKITFEPLPWPPKKVWRNKWRGLEKFFAAGFSHPTFEDAAKAAMEEVVRNPSLLWLGAFEVDG